MINKIIIRHSIIINIIHAYCGVTLTSILISSLKTFVIFLLLLLMLIFQEMFGFYLLHISCPSLYKRWANPPLSMWGPYVGFINSMVNLKQRWTKDV